MHAVDAYLRKLEKPALTREREAALGATIEAGERAILEALLGTDEGVAALAALGDELAAGTLRLDQVLRNVDRDAEALRQQTARVEHAFRVARRLRAGRAVEGKGRRRRSRALVVRLVDLRVHPDLLERLEASVRGAAPLDAVRRARRSIALAKKELVEANLRLVVSFARRYRNRGLDLLDLVQEGNVALMHAIDKFDYRRGYRLTTYASWWIKQSLDRALADQAPTIRVPIHLIESKQRIQRARRRHAAQRGSDPSAREIAAETGVPLKKVELVLGLAPQPVSLEAPLTPGGELRVDDVVADDRVPSPEQELTTRRTTEGARALLGSLSDRERAILAMRFGLAGAHEHTLEEIGASLSLTRERIRQLETRALKKLRAECEERGYRPELET